MKKLSFLLITVFISCRPNTQSSTNDQQADEAINNLVKTISGKWGAENGKPVFQISKDSMYYFSEKKSYYYMVHENNIIVLYKEGPYMLSNIHSIKDTLFFNLDESGGGQIKSFRVK